MMNIYGTLINFLKLFFSTKFSILRGKSFYRSFQWSWCYISLLYNDEKHRHYFLFFAGFLLDFISLPVITGFTSAAALIIASSQLLPILGIQGKGGGFLTAIYSAFLGMDEIRFSDLTLGLVTIVLLILLKVCVPIPKFLIFFTLSAPTAWVTPEKG